MKRLSLKIKLTLLYSSFIIILAGVVFALLLSLSSREILSSVRINLKQQVQSGTEYLSVTDWTLNVDEQFYSVADNVYLGIYWTNGSLMYGRIPYGFTEEIPLNCNGEVYKIKGEYEEWYLCDIAYELEEYGTVYVRGITSVTKAESGFRSTVRAAMLILPIFAILTAILTYHFVGRLLCPVEQSLQRERQFTSDVSHELRTPVSVILAQCEECLADIKLPEEEKRKWELIQRKADEMSEMISYLLLLSRADQGRIQLQKELVNLSELTEMVAEEQQTIANGKKIRIEMSIDPEVYLHVDESFYIHMLVNLISNAVFYGNINGKVKISLRKMKHGVSGAVEDDGIGIPEEYLPRIWDRFFRVDHARSSSELEMHSGLGLPMVKWIAEVHGGSVNVRSTLGKGSCFTFFLPEME